MYKQWMSVHRTLAGNKLKEGQALLTCNQGGVRVCVALQREGASRW